MALKVTTFVNTYGKGLSLFVMMALGFVFPQVNQISFMIQYLLMVMLFFSFLDIRFTPKMMSKGVLLILVANVAVSLLGYVFFASSNMTLALTAFITGIAPTAISSPVVIDFVHGKVSYVIAALILTNLSSAVIVPLLLPALVGSHLQISVWQLLQSSVMVMFVPLILSRVVMRLPQGTQAFFRKGKRFTFPIWLANLFIISAKAAYFILNENTGSLTILLDIALLALVICVANFSLGAWIGGKQYWKEASQALGQKNLSFVIWIALTFINPLVAMGPMFYILYHHIYNTWLISRYEKQRLQAA